MALAGAAIDMVDPLPEIPGAVLHRSTDARAARGFSLTLKP